MNSKFTYQKYKNYNFGKKSKQIYSKTNHVCSERTYVANWNELNKLAWQCNICRKFKPQSQDKTDQEMRRFFPNLFK
ncbi:hypothetical protein [endosymbiont GvMRE of Glomus versiforme]|uniref:hypothetical protein n=1 Tax=endosymbiont GvMRE of Glomus versiforme TaxID=2039283 RepID=UPI000EB99696|nr:hypothetical protein [endosymbiont GvMRE of Glomus versiforme]RHZ36754.1 hypothetical protein GvMRE_I2g70 [endosymbiont GvMRE of Glomus versiforme]